MYPASSAALKTTASCASGRRHDCFVFPPQPRLAVAMSWVTPVRLTGGGCAAAFLRFVMGRTARASARYVPQETRTPLLVRISLLLFKSVTVLSEYRELLCIFLLLFFSIATRGR